MLVTAFSGTKIALYCNSSDARNKSVFWLLSTDGINLFNIDPSDKYQFSNDNLVLNISQLDNSDEAYYACGYSQNLNNFIILTSYFVYVKGN